MKKALFLDRDGIINEDFGYVFEKENFIFKNGIFDVVKAFINNDFLVFVVTNQSGIARGYYSQEQFLKLSEFMSNEFIKHGAKIDKIYFCPHLEEQNCECRKPKSGMILKALREFNVRAQNSYLIGDKLSDIEAGFGAKIGHLFLLSEQKPKSEIKFSCIKNLDEILKEI